MSERTLPDDVLELAAVEGAVAAQAPHTWYYTGERNPQLVASRRIILAALPILTPAIETALLERMIADAEGITPVVIGPTESGDDETLVEWLRFYLLESEL